MLNTEDEQDEGQREHHRRAGVSFIIRPFSSQPMRCSIRIGGGAVQCAGGYDPSDSAEVSERRAQGLPHAALPDVVQHVADVRSERMKQPGLVPWREAWLVQHTPGTITPPHGDALTARRAAAALGLVVFASALLFARRRARILQRVKMQVQVASPDGRIRFHDAERGAADVHRNARDHAGLEPSPIVTTLDGADPSGVARRCGDVPGDRDYPWNGEEHRDEPIQWRASRSSMT